MDNDIRQLIWDRAKKYYPVKASHGLNHIEDNLNMAEKMLAFAKEPFTDQIYAAIVFHDSGLEKYGREIHEIHSAEIAKRELKDLFNSKDLFLIAAAIKEHRASFKGTFTSMLSDICSSADRNVPNFEASVARSFLYTSEHHPDFSFEEKCETVAKHLNAKYGTNGYARFPIYYSRYYRNDLREYQRKMDALTGDVVAKVVGNNGKNAEKLYDKALESLLDRDALNVVETKMYFANNNGKIPKDANGNIVLTKNIIDATIYAAFDQFNDSKVAMACKGFMQYKNGTNKHVLVVHGDDSLTESEELDCVGTIYSVTLSEPIEFRYHGHRGFGKCQLPKIYTVKEESLKDAKIEKADVVNFKATFEYEKSLTMQHATESLVDRNEWKESDIKSVSDLKDFYKECQYGIIDFKAGKPWKETHKNTFFKDWEENWKLLSVNQLLKFKCGVCYDTAKANDYFLTKFKVEHVNLFAMTKRDVESADYNDDPTHTFTVYKDEDGKWKWLEASWGTHKNNTLSESSSDKIIRKIGQLLANASGQTNYIGIVQSFPPDGTNMADFYNAMKRYVVHPKWTVKPDSSSMENLSQENFGVKDDRFVKDVILPAIKDDTLYHGSSQKLSVIKPFQLKELRDKNVKTISLTPYARLASLFCVPFRSIRENDKGQVIFHHCRMKLDEWFEDMPDDEMYKSVQTVHVSHNIKQLEPIDKTYTGYLHYVHAEDALVDAGANPINGKGPYEVVSYVKELKPYKVETIKIRMIAKYSPSFAKECGLDAEPCDPEDVATEDFTLETVEFEIPELDVAAELLQEFNAGIEEFNRWIRDLSFLQLKKDLNDPQVDLVFSQIAQESILVDTVKTIFRKIGEFIAWFFRKLKELWNYFFGKTQRGMRALKSANDLITKHKNSNGFFNDAAFEAAKVPQGLVNAVGLDQFLTTGFSPDMFSSIFNEMLDMWASRPEELYEEVFVKFNQAPTSHKWHYILAYLPTKPGPDGMDGMKYAKTKHPATGTMRESSYDRESVFILLKEAMDAYVAYEKNSKLIAARGNTTVDAARRMIEYQDRTDITEREAVQLAKDIQELGSWMQVVFKSYQSGFEFILQQMNMVTNVYTKYMK